MVIDSRNVRVLFEQRLAALRLYIDVSREICRVTRFEWGMGEEEWNFFAVAGPYVYKPARGPPRPRPSYD